MTLFFVATDTNNNFNFYLFVSIIFSFFCFDATSVYVCMCVFHWMVSIDSFACETFKETTRLEFPLCQLAISSDSNCSVFNRRGTIIPIGWGLIFSGGEKKYGRHSIVIVAGSSLVLRATARSRV